MIIFLGIAGSGKGTQAALLAKYFNSKPLSSGEILRQHKNEDRIQADLAQGDLVKDEVLLPIMEAEIKKADDAQDRLILDGFPRSMEQARWIIKKVQDGELHLSGIINLKLTPQKARERLKGRLRSDDTEAAIAKRFGYYRQNILPIIHYFRAEGFRVIDINGDQTIEKVSKDIRKALGV